MLRKLETWSGRSLTVAIFIFTFIIASATGGRALGQQSDSAQETAFQTGEYLYRAGDCPAAIPSLKAAVSANSSANLPLGACYLETGANSEAESSLTVYLQQFPSDIRAAQLLASTYQLSNRNPDALIVWQHYVSHNPDDLGGQVELGRFYLSTGEKEKAAAAFSSVLSKSPDHPGALLGSGLLAVADGKLPEAIELFSRARQIAPGAPDAFKALGDVYVKQDKCDAAIEPYNRAFELKPSDFSTAKGLAKCYVALNRFEDVRRVLQSSTLEEAKDAEAPEMVAKALKDKPQELEEYLRHAIELAPENTAARSLWAQSLMRTNEIQAAKRQYIEILKLEKDHPDPDASFKLAAIEESEGDLQNAHHHYELAATSPTATAATHLALARTDLALNDIGGAQAESGKIGAPDNESADYKILQIQINMRSGNWDTANSVVTELLSGDSGNPKLLDLGAQIALKQERYEDEAGFLERLYQAAPTDKNVRYRLVRLYVGHAELKRDDRVADLLKDFAARQETDPEGYLLLAHLYQRNKDAVNAKVYYDLGFSHMPNPAPPSFAWAYVSYAIFFEGIGNIDEALTNIKQALLLNPNDEAALFNLGAIDLRLRKTDEVQQVIDRLQGINPEAASDLQKQLSRSGRRSGPGA